MIFFRQSFQRLANVLGNNPCHYGFRNAAIGVSYQRAPWRNGFLSKSVNGFTTRPFSTFHALSHRITSSTQDGKELQEKGVACPHCGVGFNNDNALQKHMDRTFMAGHGGCKVLRFQQNKKDILSGIKPHVCEECGLGFETKTRLGEHQKVHSDLRPLECSQCDKTFKYRQSLILHTLSYHGTSLRAIETSLRTQEKAVACPHCGIGFSNDNALQKHIDKTYMRGPGGCKVLRLQQNKEDILSGIKPHVCEECGLGFKYKSDLNQHQIRHSGLRPFECSQCDKTFKGRIDLKLHVDNEHLEKKFECPDCNKLFTSKSSMNNHLKIVCRGKREFKCGQCGKEFGYKTKLEKHIKLVHDKIHPFQCPVCSKTFGVLCNFKRHMQVHHPTAAEDQAIRLS